MSPITTTLDLCRHLRRIARVAAAHTYARLVDPCFPREPRVIGAADRTSGAREKHRAAPKALAISLDAGGNRVSGFRTFDHNHTHVAVLCDWSSLYLLKSTGRLECAYVGAVTWG